MVPSSKWHGESIAITLIPLLDIVEGPKDTVLSIGLQDGVAAKLPVLSWTTNSPAGVIVFLFVIWFLMMLLIVLLHELMVSPPDTQ